MTLRFEADLEAAAHSAAAWCGEPFLHEGEDPADALATGTVRRAALDAALAEIDRGALYPSFEWSRDFSLVLGLERVLSESQPKLASGTTLRRHQVDALAGQLAALIGDLQRVVEPDESTNGDEDDDDDTAELGEIVLESEESAYDPEDDDDETEEYDEDDDDSESAVARPARSGGQRRPQPARRRRDR